MMLYAVLTLKNENFLCSTWKYRQPFVEIVLSADQKVMLLNPNLIEKIIPVTSEEAALMQKKNRLVDTKGN